MGCPSRSDRSLKRMRNEKDSVRELGNRYKSMYLQGGCGLGLLEFCLMLLKGPKCL